MGRSGPRLVRVTPGPEPQILVSSQSRPHIPLFICAFVYDCSLHASSAASPVLSSQWGLRQPGKGHRPVPRQCQPRLGRAGMEQPGRRRAPDPVGRQGGLPGGGDAVGNERIGPSLNKLEYSMKGRH